MNSENNKRGNSHTIHHLILVFFSYLVSKIDKINHLFQRMFTSRNFLLVSVILSVVIVAPVAIAIEDVARCESQSKDALRIAVVARRKTIESESLQKGIEEACNKEWKSNIRVEHYVYDDDSEGFKLISELVEEDGADIIIGPSESGLFSDLVQFLKFEKNTIPIISPIVTVRMGNDPKNWFFRTNVDAVNRAQAIYDFLSSRDIQNIALLYADRTFGEIAESAFRNELSVGQRSSFHSFRFQKPEEARLWIKQIHESRPEAIGIIGSREDVQQITPLIKGLHNEWNSYDPFVFTIVDTRTLKENGSYFLSLGQTGPVDKSNPAGELLDLSYDTTALIMTISDNILLGQGLKPTSPLWAVEFRKRFVGALSGSISSQSTRSGMEFSRLRNVAVPKVMSVVDKKAELVPDLNVSGWEKVVVNWLEIRKRRYGLAPIINVSLVGFIVVMLTIFDLQKSHRVSSRDLIRLPFIMLMLLNLLVSVCVFTFTAEQGMLEWDSLLGAMVVAFGYSGLLKTTIFETDAGQSIGIRRYYENLVVWIYDRIRKQQFEKVGPIINYIAYANSRTYLRSTLLESYGFAGGEERTAALTKCLDDLLAKETTIIGQRKVLAKEVIDEVSWKKLEERRIIPHNSLPKDIRDPEPLVDQSVDYCLLNDLHSLTDLQKMVQDRLSMANTQDLNDEFDADFTTATTPRAKMASCIRWLILLSGCDVKLLIKAGLLPFGYNMTAKPSWWEKSLFSKHRGSERRQYPHIKTMPSPVTIMCGDDNAEGNLIDVSEGGVRLEVDRATAVSSKDFLVSSKDIDAGPTLENASVCVVNSIELPNGRSEVGARWDGLARLNRSKLNTYLTSILGDEDRTKH